MGGGNFQYGPAGATWTLAAGAGISSAFTSGNPGAPEGGQVAFIQGGNTAVISQTVANFQAGVNYTVSFYAAQRGNGNNGGQDFDVYLDSTLLGTYRPAGTGYQQMTATFTTAAGSHTLKFAGRDTAGGDNTAFIDGVQITGSAAAGVEWLVSDQLGTPRMVIDHTGSLAGVKRHDYFPFGEEILPDGSWRNAAHGYGASDGVRQKFTKYERDSETGLDYAKARYYANAVGRFTSPDPLLSSGKPASPQSWNRYTYTANNPLKYVDPQGLDWGYYDEEVKGGHIRHFHYFKGEVGKYGKNIYTRVDFGKKGYDEFTDTKTGDIVRISNDAKHPFEIRASYREPQSSEGSKCLYCGQLSSQLQGKLQPVQKVATGAAVVAAAEIALPVIALEAAGAAGGEAVEETTTLYRAVSHAEFEQIMETGTFEAGPNSLGGKFFAESAEDAAQWGEALEGPNNFRIVDDVVA